MIENEDARMFFEKMQEFFLLTRYVMHWNKL